MENYKKNIRNFSILLGYIKLAMSFDSYSDVLDKYEQVSKIISDWASNYFLNKNFSNIMLEKNYEIYNIIDEIREQKLFDKTIGEDKNISDEILIWYEIVIKSINAERGN